MDNSFIGADDGGIGAIDVEFPIYGRISRIIEIIHPPEQVPVEGYSIPGFASGYLEPVSPIHGPPLITWQNYTRGMITKNYGHGGVPGVQNSNLFFSHGMVAAPNQTAGGSPTYDGDEPDFTESIDYVGPDGWHIPIDFVNWNKSRSRYGYALFIREKWRDSAPCISCGGKGWKVADLIPAPPPAPSGTYQRVPCPDCNGSRFEPSGVPPRQLDRWYEPYWEPLEDWVSPVDLNAIALGAVQAPPDRLERTEFVMGSPIRYIDAGPLPSGVTRYFQTEAPTKFNESNIHTDFNESGILPNFVFAGFIGHYEEVEHEFEPEGFKVEGKIQFEDEGLVESFPLVSNIGEEKVPYIPGYGPDESPLNVNRDTPTHAYEKGIWKLEGGLTGIEPLEPLRIRYLQVGWAHILGHSKDSVPRPRF
jgi:hypothetical protein